eukprot:767334-Hanusia_phi.AAC.1
MAGANRLRWVGLAVVMAALVLVAGENQGGDAAKSADATDANSSNTLFSYKDITRDWLTDVIKLHKSPKDFKRFYCDVRVFFLSLRGYEKEATNHTSLLRLTVKRPIYAKLLHEVLEDSHKQPGEWIQVKEPVEGYNVSKKSVDKFKKFIGQTPSIEMKRAVWKEDSIVFKAKIKEGHEKDGRILGLAMGTLHSGLNPIKRFKYALATSLEVPADLPWRIAHIPFEMTLWIIIDSSVMFAFYIIPHADGVLNYVDNAGQTPTQTLRRAKGPRRGRMRPRRGDHRIGLPLAAEAAFPAGPGRVAAAGDPALIAPRVTEPVAHDTRDRGAVRRWTAGVTVPGVSRGQRDLRPQWGTAATAILPPRGAARCNREPGRARTHQSCPTERHCC